MAVESIRRGLEGEIKPRLDHPEVLDALRKGNIQDVVKALPSGVTKEDVEEYLKHQWAILDQGLLQNVQIKADEAGVPPVTMANMLPMTPDNTLTAEDRQLLQQGLGVHKAAKVSKVAATGGIGADQLTDMVTAHMTEFNEFMNGIHDKILEVQLTQELASKKAELQQELQKIIAMMREGKIDPEYVLIALAKVQISERGLLFTQYGRRIMHANDEMSRISKDIAAAGADPTKWGMMEVAKQKMGEKAQSMQQFTSLMQKISQDIESIFSFAKGASESIINTKKEIVRHIGSSSGA